MKKTIARAAAIAAVATLALAGCGITDEEPKVAAPTIEEEAPAEEVAAEAPAIEEETEEEKPEEKPAAKQGGPGVYQADLMSGGVSTAAIPGSGPSDLEEFREKVGVDPVGYIVVEIDNTEGTDSDMLFELQIVDGEGKTHTYEDVMTATMDWDSGMTHWEEQADLWDKYPYETLPGAKNTVVLIGPEVPETIKTVFIGYEQAERVGDL